MTSFSSGTLHTFVSLVLSTVCVFRFWEKFWGLFERCISLVIKGSTAEVLSSRKLHTYVVTKIHPFLVTKPAGDGDGLVCDKGREDGTVA